MGTTPRGIVYPDPSSQPRRQDLEDLALSTDAAIVPIGGQTEVELFSASGLGSGNAISINVLFPEAFEEIPTVWANLAGFVTGSGFARVRQCDNITLTGFRLAVSNLGPSAATFTDLPVRWWAVYGLPWMG